MTFGEFEWQTNAIIEHQVNVNLFGTMNFTRSFLPLARKYKTRIINVTSHCALEVSDRNQYELEPFVKSIFSQWIQALPGLAPYAATKAGLRFWNDALRVELKKYGVEVVNFIPGSQVMCTNITARQEQFATEMMTAFTDEQLEFYGDYFECYMNYLKHISGTKPVQIISDGDLFVAFRSAITDYTPKAIYKCEPLR